jgi:shikimate kinase
VDEDGKLTAGAPPVQRSARPIVLVGLMGAGKTAVGKRLAQQLGVTFVDSDQAIEQAAGMTIADIFERYGEAEFRALERRVIHRLLVDGSAGVVALGGGAFVDAETRALVLERGHVFWLKADIDVLVERTAKKPGKRPLLAAGDPRAILTDLSARREPYYAMAHDIVVSGTGPLTSVVAEVAAKARATGGAA